MNEQLQKNPVTLSRYILSEQKTHPEAQGDLTILLSSIQLACKVISNACSKAGIFNMYGLDGSTNTTGDQVKKLDVYSNDSFIDALAFSGRVSAMVSEENEAPIILRESLEGKYFVAFDPLDGSSNIDANVSVGTIFGIWKQEKDDPATVEELLLPGSKLVAAGYAMYGAATILVLCTGEQVNGFTLDPALGEFILTHKNIRIPEKGKIYSINEGNYTKWDSVTKKYVDSCKKPSEGKPKSMRYIGSMVADVHRTLLYGGIFMYPGDSKVLPWLAGADETESRWETATFVRRSSDGVSDRSRGWRSEHRERTRVGHRSDQHSSTNPDLHGQSCRCAGGRRHVRAAVNACG